MKFSFVVVSSLLLTGMSPPSAKLSISFSRIDIKCAYKIAREKLKSKDLRVSWNEGSDGLLGYGGYGSSYSLSFFDNDLSKIVSVSRSRISLYAGESGSELDLLFDDGQADPDRHPDRPKICARLTELKEIFSRSCLLSKPAAHQLSAEKRLDSCESR